MHLVQGRVLPVGFEPYKTIVALYLANHPAEVDAYFAEVLRNEPRSDGEPYIYLAATAAACHRPAIALECLRIAVSLNDCAYPTAETHPIFASVRALPEYAAFRTTLVQCHDRFMAAMK
jgi:hypothetical protein